MPFTVELQDMDGCFTQVAGNERCRIDPEGLENLLAHFFRIETHIAACYPAKGAVRQRFYDQRVIPAKVEVIQPG